MHKPEDDQVWCRMDGLFEAPVLSERCILSAQTGVYVQLNEAAAVLWDRLPAGAADLRQALLDTYELDADAATEVVRDFLQRCQQENLISIQG